MSKKHCCISNENDASHFNQQHQRIPYRKTKTQHCPSYLREEILYTYTYMYNIMDINIEFNFNKLLE